MDETIRNRVLEKLVTLFEADCRVKVLREASNARNKQIDMTLDYQEACIHSWLLHFLARDIKAIVGFDLTGEDITYLSRRALEEGFNSFASITVEDIEWWQKSEFTQFL